MRIVALASLIALTFIPTVNAALTGFDFTAAVSYLVRSPFGSDAATILSSPITGRILYDSASTATDAVECGSGQCLGYRQHIAGGMSVNVGGLLIAADDYVVQVKNDVALGGDPVDRLTFIYRFDLSPSLASQLKVNDVPQLHSWFQFDLETAKETFDGTSLPPSIDIARYISSGNVLDEDARRTYSSNGTWYNSIDVLFTTTSLSALPVAGDYNHDQTVNSSDYIIWRATFDSTSELAADGNGNQVVDAADYVIWRKNQSAVSQSTVIPEPSVFVLISIGVWALIASTRRVSRPEV